LFPRLRFVLAAFAGLALALGARLVWLGAFADVGAPSVSAFATPAGRGALWDRNGHVVAVPSFVYDVAVAPREVTDHDALAAAVSPVLGHPAAEVRAAVAEPGAAWVVLARGLRDGDAQALASLDLDGLHIEPHARRRYPLGQAAAHLTGYVSHDGQGVYGVEGRHDRALVGTEGALTGSRGTDPRGFRPARDGLDLVLTIDRTLQVAAFDALAQAVASEGATGGTVVVLDPRTGAVLASTSWPSFDPELYPEADPAAMLDPAVSAQYEPGSVVKAMTMAAALDAGVVQVDSTYNDTGFVEVAGARISNWDRLAHGPTSMTELLKASLNVGAVDLARKLGPETFYGYMAGFGFGATTGIDVTGEIAGALRTPTGTADWFEGDLATSSFGQGMAATPIQVAAAMAALANDGRLMVPHVVAARVAPGGRPEPVAPRLVRQVVTPGTARALRGMLAEVVSGRVTQAALPGYSVGGKTGTSQIAENGAYATDGTIASFAGFLPVDDPAVVILVKIDRPESARGSDAAAPVFKAVAQAAATALGIPPDRPGELTWSAP
jgi:cell division protein FtsI/penicillin-binding protein 2